jgi:hypothetical protein
MEQLVTFRRGFHGGETHFAAERFVAMQRNNGMSKIYKLKNEDGLGPVI